MSFRTCYPTNGPERIQHLAYAHSLRYCIFDMIYNIAHCKTFQTFLVKIRKFPF